MARVVTANLIYQYGDSFDDYFVVWVDASGNPINLSGYTATMRIKAVAGGGTGETTLLTLAGGDGLTIDAPNGKISFNATATKMTGGTLVQNTKYKYDLQVVSGTEKKTLIKGDFWVDPEVTTD